MESSRKALLSGLGEAEIAAAGGRPPFLLDWRNLSVLFAGHVLAVVAIVYMATVHFSWWTLGLGVLWGVLCGLGITGGYHRLFSHATYRAHPALRAFYLLFGAASVQNSALLWSADHREHHTHTDQDGDPYNIQRGFWWAHVLWVLDRSTEVRDLSRVRDLEADPLVRLQHRFYVPLAILVGVVVPGLLGLLWGDPLGAILVAGFLRLVVQWHGTFSVNSLAHMFGRRPYSTKNSARDSFWVALVTFGEGYHNFHHRFQGDYRNGVRWFHYDPTKWWVWTMARLGLAGDLRRTSNERIAAARAAILQSTPATTDVG